MVFSAVLVSISFFLFCFMIMHTRISLMKTAVETAEKAANTQGFYEKTLDLILSNEQVLFEETIEKKDLPEQKERQDIPAKLYQQLEKGLIKPERIYVKITLENNFLTKSIKVDISEDIKIPFGRVKALGDGRDYLTLTARGRAVIVNPTQYIRNVDLSLEYLNRIKEGKKLLSNGK